jgi:hypothetical protein
MNNPVMTVTISLRRALFVTGLLLTAPMLAALSDSPVPTTPAGIPVPLIVTKSVAAFRATMSPKAVARIDRETHALTRISGPLLIEFAALPATKVADTALTILNGGVGVSPEDLVFSEELRTPFGISVVYQQVFSGKPVVNARLSVDITSQPRPFISVTNNLLQNAQAPPQATIDEATARSKARAQFILDARRSDGVDLSSFDDVTMSEPSVKHILYSKGGRLWDVFDIVLSVTRKGGRQIVAQHEYFIDTEKGAIVESATRLHRSHLGRGRIFDPNPIVTLGTATPTQDDVIAALTCVTLPNLDDANNGVFTLTGKFARIVDVEEPPDMPRSRTLSTQSDPDFAESPNCVDFAAVMAYYHVDRLQQRMISLGFDWAAMVPQEIDVSGFGKPFSHNSVFENHGDGLGPLVFARDSLRYVAEDAEVIAHEYGHAILARKTKVRFGTSDLAVVINEGFADYWGISSFLPQGASRFCYAPWLGGGTCFRTLAKQSDLSTVLTTSDLFAEGDKWTTTLFDVADAIGDHDQADAIIFWGHVRNVIFGANPTMPCIADAIVHTTALSSTPEVVKKVCAAFTKHGLVQPSSCTILPSFTFSPEVDCR